jgi:hypothetical protein
MARPEFAKVAEDLLRPENEVLSEVTRESPEALTLVLDRRQILSCLYERSAHACAVWVSTHNLMSHPPWPALFERLQVPLWQHDLTFEHLA